MTDATTVTGVDETTADGDFNPEAAFLNRFMSQEDADASKKKPPEEKAEEKPSEQAEEPSSEDASDESPEDTAEDTEAETDEKDAKKYVEDDAVFVKIKVGDEELEVPVKDLKRLHGQEAALTRRSQEVARQREQVTQQQQHYTVGLQRLVQQAEARANQFRQVNFLALAKDPNVGPEQLTYLQEQAQAAFQEESFFKNELSNTVQAVQKHEMDRLAEVARETVKELGDAASPYYIEGWSQQKYGEILSFAKAEGLDPAVADNLVDKSALKILHMAMLYKQGSKATTKKVVKTPKKIVKSPASPPPSQQSKDTATKKSAMKKLRSEGSQDAAAEAFLANWAENSSD